MVSRWLLAAITMTSVLQTIYGRGEAGVLIFMAKVLSFLTFGTNPTENLDPVQLQILTDALLATRLYANAAERTLAVIPPRALPPRRAFAPYRQCAACSRSA